MFEKGQAGIPKPAEIERSWLLWNDEFMRLLNNNQRSAAVVLAGAWALMPVEYAGTPGAVSSSPAPSAIVGGGRSPAPADSEGE